MINIGNLTFPLDCLEAFRFAILEIFGFGVTLKIQKTILLGIVDLVYEISISAPIKLRQKFVKTKTGLSLNNGSAFQNKFKLV
jgi:hypothetical protein